MFLEVCQRVWIVVPHAGTWIEIVGKASKDTQSAVVPHAGTWIEILDTEQIDVSALSFPTRERGLKYGQDQ